jgi:glutamate racemase
MNKNNRKAKIGVIDSGYGGLTVLNEIIKVLPEYDYIYLGDNARAPYGTKSFEVVLEHTWECVTFLFEQGCELIIIACNTASAKALRTIQQLRLNDFPGKRVLGVIRPSAEIIGQKTTYKKIGVLATEGTVKSNSYTLEIEKFFPDLEVVQQACPLWVPLIENNSFSSPEGAAIVNKDLNHFLVAHPDLDTIILGCTHYPIMMDLLIDLAPKIHFISQGEIVAQALRSYLSRHLWLVKKLSTGKTVTYLTTEHPVEFDNKVKELFGLIIYSQNIHL